jgi:hypothetical protein
MKLMIAKAIKITNKIAHGLKLFPYGREDCGPLEVKA